jgi:alanine racemase
MVRLGIGVYGVSNDPAEQKYLENVGTLKSVISQIRTITAGRVWDMVENLWLRNPLRLRQYLLVMQTEFLEVGEMGLDLSPKIKKAKILGSVCMDMLMVDVTEIDCTEGDSVIVFYESPTVSQMAKVKHNTL